MLHCARERGGGGGLGISVPDRNVEEKKREIKKGVSIPEQESIKMICKKGQDLVSCSGSPSSSSSLNMRTRSYNNENLCE